MMLKLNDTQATIIKARIKAAREYQEQMWANSDADTADSFADNPARWLALVKGQYWRNRRGTGVPRRQVNQIGPKLKTKQDALTAGETAFFAEPMQERFQGGEDDVAALLTTTWEAQRFDQVYNRARWDSDIYGFGVVEWGWRWERNGEKLEGERGEPEVPADAAALSATAEPVGPEVVQEYESEAQAEAAAREAELDEDRAVWGDPTLDDPFVERFCPRCLFVDPNCTSWDLSDARYAFRKRWQYVELIKRDKRLTNTKDLKGTVYSIHEERDGTLTADRPEARADQALVTLYDGYVWFDTNGNGREEFLHVVMTDEHDKPLYCDLAWCVDDEGKPILPVSPFPFRVIPAIVADNDTFYPESSVEQAVGLQLDYDESSSAFNDQRRKSPRQYLIPKGILDQAAIKKLEAGIDGAMIEVDAALKDQIVPFPHQPLRQELYASLEAIPLEIGKQLGISPYDEASLPSKDMTRAEVLTLQNAGATRTTGDGKRFREFKEDGAMCLLALLQHFGDRARGYSYEMPDGSRAWGMMRNVDLRGTDANGDMLPIGVQWRIKLDVSQEAPKNKEMDRQTKVDLLQGLAAFAQAPDPMTGQPMVNIKPVLRMLAQAFDIKDVNSVIPPDPTPEEMEAIQQQRMAEEEAQMQAQAGAESEMMAREDAERQAASEREERQLTMQQIQTLADIVSKLPPEVLQRLSSGGIANFS